ncbi:unnamed protein product [Mytilus edulis]|uniref:B box-type domain-containing protein n=1 Tax=Mytilus edulis TaxID=6550 RepID=A0A8S3RWW3_MYTED|nr:unnamed protein product [Mytilus edulis]
MNAKSFGEVRPDYRPQVEYCTKDLKTESGETGPMIKTIEKIKDIQFDCGRKKNLKITCCRILPDKRFVVSVLDNLRLTVHKEDGSLEKSLILQGGSVFGITVIDIQRIAVSHGNRTIDVISLIDEKKKSSFDIDRHCEVYDLVFNNHKLFFGSSSVYTNEILISTMSGKIMGCIPVPKHQSPSTFPMAQLGDKIYFTCKGKTCEKVVCCDLTGDTLWKFGSRKDISKCPIRHQSGINVRFRTDDNDSLKLPDEQLSGSVSAFHTYDDDYYSHFPDEHLSRRASRVRVYDKDSLTASLAIDKYGNVIVTDKSDGVQAVSCDGKVGKVILKEPTTMIDYDMNLNINGQRETTSLNLFRSESIRSSLLIIIRGRKAFGSDMADDSKVKCGPCEYKRKSERARKWCTECEEGYCNECVKDHELHKILRDHRVISINDYLKIADISKMHQRCNTHGENFEYFSPSQDKIFCFKCLSTSFIGPKDIITVKEALHSSNAIDDMSNLETKLDDLLKEIEHRIKCHEESAEYIDDKVDRIICKIKDIRNKINKKLDKLEARAIDDLKHNAHVKIMTEKHHILKESKKEARKIKRNIALTKEYASDKSIFIFSRRVLEPIDEIKRQ